jgi:hypothetical protein
MLASLSDSSEVSIPLVLVALVFWLSTHSESESGVCESSSMIWMGVVCNLTCMSISRSHLGRESMYALKEVNGCMAGCCTMEWALTFNSQRSWLVSSNRIGTDELLGSYMVLALLMHLVSKTSYW